MFVEPTPGIIRAVSVATDALIQIKAVETSSETAESALFLAQGL